MSLINEDMEKALESLDLQDNEHQLMVELLYTERINKNKEWTVDAVKYIKDRIDAFDTGDVE